MLFNSYIFLFVFLPVSLLGYFLLNHFKKTECAKFFLVCMSLWFYAYFHVSYLAIILSSILFNYICHLLLVKKIRPKLTLVLGIAGSIGILCYFKYFRFLLENLNLLLHADFSLPDILLPLGISFFTFQQIGFLVDTAKGGIRQENFLDYTLFVVFFPQLIAGPIVSHEEMLPQFKDPSRKSFRFDHFYQGIRIFVLGLAKKVLLADTFGQAVNWGFGNHTLLSSMETFLVILFYTFQIYFDFSGYCDMARGIGKMFNIQIPVNFLSPYKSANILEFWDRWHMTLTRFFTKYVYIPLGGSRKGTLRTYVNVLIVFFVSGLWHGAGWTFVLWGCLHGILSILTRIWKRFRQRLSLPSNRVTHAAAVLLTFSFIMLAWTVFRADSLSQAFAMLRNMFSFQGVGLHKQLTEVFQLSEFFYVMKFFGLTALPFSARYCMILFILIAVFFIFFCKNLYETEEKSTPKVIKTVILSVLFVWCVLSLSGVSTFLYFNF